MRCITCLQIDVWEVFRRVVASPRKPGFINWIYRVCHVRPISKRMGYAWLRKLARVRCETAFYVGTDIVRLLLAVVIRMLVFRSLCIELSLNWRLIVRWQIVSRSLLVEMVVIFIIGVNEIACRHQLAVSLQLMRSFIGACNQRRFIAWLVPSILSRFHLFLFFELLLTGLVYLINVLLSRPDDLHEVFFLKFLLHLSLQALSTFYYFLFLWLKLALPLF